MKRIFASAFPISRAFEFFSAIFRENNCCNKETSHIHILNSLNTVMYLEYTPENEHHQCCNYSTQNTKWQHKPIEKGIKTSSYAEYKLSYVISISEQSESWNNRQSNCQDYGCDMDMLELSACFEPLIVEWKIDSPEDYQCGNHYPATRL